VQIQTESFSAAGNMLAATADDITMRIWGGTDGNMATWPSAPKYSFTTATTGFCTTTAQPMAYFSPVTGHLALVCIPGSGAGSTTINIYGAAGTVGTVSSTTTTKLYYTNTVPQGPVAWHAAGTYFAVATAGSSTFSDYVDLIGSVAASPSTDATAWTASGSTTPTSLSFRGDLATTKSGVPTAFLSVTGLAFNPVPATYPFLAIQQDFNCFTRVRASVPNGLNGVSISSGQPTPGFTINPGWFWWQPGLLGGAVAWSPAGTFLASACSDSIVRIFGGTGSNDVTTWSTQPIRTFNTNAGAVYSVMFSPSAEFLAAGTAAGRIILYGGCSPGTEVAGTGANAVCSSCAVGTASTTYGVPCAKCGTGTYQNAGGASSCTACGLGNTSSLGATVCTLCAAGKIGAALINTACDDCEAGFQQPSTGKTMCNLCSSGRFTAQTGRTACAACEWCRVVRGARGGGVACVLQCGRSSVAGRAGLSHDRCGRCELFSTIT
jgi:hypothetical protein